LAKEPDSEVYAFAAVGSIPRSYNLLLEAANRREDLEALVLVHPHVEITDRDFCAKVREALSDPDVAVVGSIGATGVRTIAWWEGAVRTGPVIHHYGEHGGGELPAFAWAQPDAAPGEVEVVDGFLMVLSPWAVRNLRFDEGLALGHGYDLDFCMQARAHGRLVITADLRCIYHHSLELVGEKELELWVEAHIHTARKWDGNIPGVESNGQPDWKQRARRAEADREAARAIAYSNALGSDARVLELERALEATTSSTSWKLTQPLRSVNQWRVRARKQLAERRKRDG
jgi:hypothetical protein